MSCYDCEVHEHGRGRGRGRRRGECAMVDRYRRGEDVRSDRNCGALGLTNSCAGLKLNIEPNRPRFVLACQTSSSPSPQPRPPTLGIDSDLQTSRSNSASACMRSSVASHYRHLYLDPSHLLHHHLCREILGRPYRRWIAGDGRPQSRWSLGPERHSLRQRPELISLRVISHSLSAII